MTINITDWVTRIKSSIRSSPVSLQVSIHVNKPVCATCSLRITSDFKDALIEWAQGAAAGVCNSISLPAGSGSCPRVKVGAARLQEAPNTAVLIAMGVGTAVVWGGGGRALGRRCQHVYDVLVVRWQRAVLYLCVCVWIAERWEVLARRQARVAAAVTRCHVGWRHHAW